MADALAHELICRRLGRVEYPDGLEMMRQCVKARFEEKQPDTLLLLEHPPVITLGRGATKDNIVVSQKRLEEEGVAVFETDRGGDVTYHGPGQLVGYPIFRLPPDRQDVRRYVRDVEECLIRALAGFGIVAHRESKWPGVWVKKPGTNELAKIAAIGVHLSRWMTRHGFALNVNTHLPHFNLIVPCGIREAGVTSMAEMLGQSVSVEEVMDAIETAFGDTFGARLTPRDVDIETVCVVVVNRVGQILLLRRVPAKGGFWQPITGKLAEGETPLDAATREVLEETGAALNVRPLSYSHSFALGDAESPVFCRETAFFALWSDADVHLDEKEHDAIEWVSEGDAMERLPHEGLKVAVKAAIKQTL